MASHQLAIAKATFAASLLRPDSTFKSVARDQVSQFHTLIDAAIVQCSPANIQVCYEYSILYTRYRSLNLNDMGRLAGSG